jgi:hypothetical protein
MSCVKQAQAAFRLTIDWAVTVGERHLSGPHHLRPRRWSA